MAAKHFLICAFLFWVAVAKAQEVAKPVLLPKPKPIYPFPVVQPPKIVIHERMMREQMDVPLRSNAPNREEIAALKEANSYLDKIRKILSKDDFAVYQKKEARLVPDANPFGLLQIRKKYYQIFVEYNDKNKHEKPN